MKARSLRTKLLFQYMMLVIVCMLVIPGAISWMMNSKFHEFSAEKLVEDKQQLVTVIEKSLNSGDTSGSGLHGEMLRWPIKRFCVYDKKGKELFRVTHMSRRKYDPKRAEREKEMERHLVGHSEELHDANGVRTGMVTFYIIPFNMSKEGMFLREFERNMYCGIAVMLFFAAFFAIYMTGKIVRPVLKTAKRAKSISEGNYKFEKDLVSDIKEIQTLVDSVDKLGEELAEQEELRKRLMTDIAHELRNPVTIVKAQLEAFADGIWQPTQERLNLTLSEIDRLSTLISEVEKLTTVEKSASGLNVVMTDLSLLAEKTAHGVEPLFNAKGVELNINITPDVKLMIDPARVREVVANLVSNALRYTDKGGSVTVSLTQEGGNVKFSVQDTGIGISKEDLPNIFERFYRADKSRARASGGMGIGLAIVKAIVEAHGATIMAESEEGVGSVFTVVFPKG